MHNRLPFYMLRLFYEMVDKSLKRYPIFFLKIVLDEIWFGSNKKLPFPPCAKEKNVFKTKNPGKWFRRGFEIGLVLRMRVGLFLKANQSF